MKLPRFDCAQPGSLEEACLLLERGAGAALPIAGGSELVPALRNRQKTVRVLVDLKCLPGLDQIRFDDREGLRLGALVTLRRLAAHPVVRQRYAVLAEAASSAGSVQLRAMGTLGGNLCQDTCCAYFNRSPLAREMLAPCHKLGGDVCHVVQGSEDCWAVYAGDLAPALLALGATLRLLSPRGERSLPLARLYSGDGLRPLALGPGELIVEVAVEAPSPGSGSAYLKLAQREALDYPLLGVAARLAVDPDTGMCGEATLALTAVDTAPVVVQEAESLKARRLDGGALDAVARAARKVAHPMKNAAGLPPGYRQSMVEVYARRALRRALERTAP